MKYFRMSYDEVVFKRSYLNLILLNIAIPSTKPINEDEEEKPKKQIEKIKVGDNLNDFFMNFM